GGALGAAALVCASAVETKPLPSFITAAPPASPTPAAAAVVPSSVRRLTPLLFSLSLMIASSAFGLQVAGGVVAPTGDAAMGLPPAVMIVSGPLPPGRIEGDDMAIRFSRFRRT